jgi:prepilin-type N-terminal cleavage/methylation domain-containing protein/prepilin-type processing-associated H-X9-DG protein
MTSRRGFTLIELLVVIAIIAILAAILFPVFAKAREKARQASCQSNLKQLMTAFRQYVQDADEVCPHKPGYWAGTPDYNRSFLRYQFQPYIKNWQVYKCPSMNTGLEGDPSNITYQWMYAYGYNETLCGVEDSAIRYPAELTTLADSVHFQLNAGHCAWANVCQASCTPALQIGKNCRHTAGSNLAYYDGHVKYLMAPTIFGSSSDTRAWGIPTS